MEEKSHHDLQFEVTWKMEGATRSSGSIKLDYCSVVMQQDKLHILRQCKATAKLSVGEDHKDESPQPVSWQSETPYALADVAVAASAPALMSCRAFCPLVIRLKVTASWSTLIYVYMVLEDDDGDAGALSGPIHSCPTLLSADEFEAVFEYTLCRCWLTYAFHRTW